MRREYETGRDRWLVEETYDVLARCLYRLVGLATIALIHHHLVQLPPRTRSERQ